MSDQPPAAPAGDDRRGEDDAPEHRDAEDIANEELPLDPAAPTELGSAVDG